MVMLIFAVSMAARNPAKPKPLADFNNSLGVNVHMEYTDGAYANTAEALKDLDYLGVHQLRDGTPDPSGGIPFHNQLDAINKLAGAGNRFDFIVSMFQSIEVALSQIAAIETAHPGAVVAIEGPNEINNLPFKVKYAGLTGDAAARAFQRALYAAVRSNPVLKQVPVYDLTGVGRIDLREEKGFADFANAHPYPYHGDPPGPRLASEFLADYAMTPPYPRVITETGYFNNPKNPVGSGVDNAIQAKLTLDLLLDAFSQGLSKTFLYQLRAAYPDVHRTDADSEYGLFNLDNSPKPVATAIHNLTRILSDPDPTVGQLPVGILRYQLTGLPSSGNSLLFQRANGAFALIVWAEPAIWEERTHSPVAISASDATLTLRKMAKSVQLSDPLLQDQPVRTMHGIRTLHFALADHPVVIDIAP
jgi:hypothetical protein